MKNFLSSLLAFFRRGPRFATGALPSPEDKRNLNVAAFQVPAALPDEFETVLPRVRDQGPKSKCVASAISTLAELYIIRKNPNQAYPLLSDDDLYDQCKLVDGLPQVLGTYPSVGASVAFKQGIATEMAYATSDASVIAKSRIKPFGGYAFVSPDFASVTQAIYQNQAVTGTVGVDANFFAGIITKILQLLGSHYTVWKGAKVSARIVKGRNSWGVAWIGHIAGMINPSVKPGEFEMLWDDVSPNVRDIIAFADIPPEILKAVTEKPYHFNRTLKRGDTGADVLELQKRLAQEACWDASVTMVPLYGPATAAAVLRYQTKHMIISTPAESSYGSFAGPKTMYMLNGEVGLDLASAIIQVESEGNDYAIGDKNLTDKAYGCMQIRQGVMDQVNAKLGTRYSPSDLLGNRSLSVLVFNTYWTIFPSLITDEDKARAWNGGPYWKTEYGKPGYDTYTKALDTYWAKVQAVMQ